MPGAAALIAASGTILTAHQDDFCEKTSSSRKSGTNQSSGYGAAPSVAVSGASPGSAIRQFWRNELLFGETNSFAKTPRNQCIRFHDANHRLVSTMPASTLPAAIGRGFGEAKPPRRSR